MTSNIGKVYCFLFVLRVNKWYYNYLNVLYFASQNGAGHSQVTLFFSPSIPTIVKARSGSECSPWNTIGWFELEEKAWARGWSVRCGSQVHVTNLFLIRPVATGNLWALPKRGSFVIIKLRRCVSYHHISFYRMFCLVRFVMQPFTGSRWNYASSVFYSLWFKPL